MYFNKCLFRIMTVSAIMSAITATSVFASVSGKLNGDNINIRSEASTNGNIIGKESSGKELSVLGKDGEWFNVLYNGSPAYVTSDYFVINKVDATVTGDGVNIRTLPDISADVIESLSKGSGVIVTGKVDDWYQIDVNGGQAYINKNYVNGIFIDYVGEATVDKSKSAKKQEEVTTSEEVVVKSKSDDKTTLENAIQNSYGIVTSQSGLKLRADASIESDVITVLPSGDIVDVISSQGEWIKVETDDGNKGYVNANYCSVRSGEKPSRSLNSSKADQIISYAKRFIGTPYVYGGTNLNSGVDCSGFVYSVMKNFGINLNRSSASMASNGVYVSRNSLEPGDLVFFDTTGVNDGGISHVGIYIGNNQYIHASSGKSYSVIISSLSDAYSSSTYVTARRVLR